MATKYLSESGVSTLWTKVKAIVNAKYTKPSTGIPKSDLETAVQTTLDNAVAGPASSTDTHVVVFNGATGKIVKDSGFTIEKSVPSTAQFTDYSVTNENYHYSPTENTASKLDANTVETPNGAIGAIKRDSKGHVTGIEVVNISNIYKKKQTAVSSPSASGNATAYIDTISQSTDGVITATKKTIPAASSSQDGLMVTTDKTKLDGVAAGAQVNVIESVSVNGSALTVTNKGVNITVPTNNNALTNGAGYQTKSDVETIVNQKLTTAIIPKGNLAANDLFPATESTLGYMYNITTSFKIQSGVFYVNGQSKSSVKFLYHSDVNEINGDYPAGTNVYVVKGENSSEYYWDIMNGFVNLDDYIQALTDAEITAICV